jgi:hypothetical protein
MFLCFSNEGEVIPCGIWTRAAMLHCKYEIRLFFHGVCCTLNNAIPPEIQADILWRLCRYSSDFLGEFRPRDHELYWTRSWTHTLVIQMSSSIWLSSAETLRKSVRNKSSRCDSKCWFFVADLKSWQHEQG